MSDSVANLLTMIRNAQAVGKENVKIPFSGFCLRVAEKLQEKGFLSKVEKSGKTGKRYLDITLSYEESGEGKIKQIARVSKPGQRMYSDYRNLRVRPGVTTIVSTPKGLMTGVEARKMKLGGEIVCEVR